MTPTMMSTQNLPIAPEIRNFLEQILIEGGMEDLDELIHEQMVQDLYARLIDRLFGTALIKLSEANRKAFEKMVEKKEGPEKLLKFLQEKIKDFEEVFAGAMMDFKFRYLGKK
jgi:predicted alpha/beta-fold hydrolase